MASSFIGISEIEDFPMGGMEENIYGERLAGWARAYFQAAAAFISETAKHPGLIEIELKSECMYGAEERPIPQGSGTFEGIQADLFKSTSLSGRASSQIRTEQSFPQCHFRGVCRHQERPRHSSRLCRSRDIRTGFGRSICGTGG